MSENTTVRSGGIGFFGLLTILFIALKLTGVSQVATWSWFWVLSPLWIPALVTIGIIIVILFIALLAGAFKG